MCQAARPFSRTVLLLCILSFGTAAGNAQIAADGFVTGAAQESWEHWQAAMESLLERGEDPAVAEELFRALLDTDPSPFRVALLADRTVRRTAMGGAVLLFEQDYESGDLEDSGTRVAELLVTGREQMNQADDGWYFCQVGRFDVANANFQALINADPDPVALLEFADRVPRRRDILVQLLDNAAISNSVRAILSLLDEGETIIKADPLRVQQNILRLGGPPRGYENACDALQQSGEYAIPFVVQTLRNPPDPDLVRPILRCLPLIDRPALNPLVMAFRTLDQPTRIHLIEAAGKIGYAQAVPYLLRIQAAEATSDQVRSAVDDALEAISARGSSIPTSLSAADAFYQLAEQYYADADSLAADDRLDEANVWYWSDEILQNTRVPTQIFNEVMCMRACEEALRLNPDHKAALALWLAANFRREAQLPLDAADATRPENYPSAAYFAQAAGAEYCLMALARAVDDQDPAVALGTIDALHRTAGPASLTSGTGGRSPLAEALSFSDRMVRIRAALTLANARPVEEFHNHQNLMPVLIEALMLHGGAKNALVIDPDDASANLRAGALRGLGYEVLVDNGLYTGLAQVRESLPGLDIVVLASDVQTPPLARSLTALRSEFQFAATPVVLVGKRGQMSTVEELARADYRLAAVGESAGGPELLRAITEVSRAVGAQAITPEVGADLAFAAAESLRLLAVTENPLFDVYTAESALLATLDTSDLDLRLTVVEVLGYLGTQAAQEAVGAIALNEQEAKDVRIAMFRSLATAAKRRGNQLGEEMVLKIVETVEKAEDLDIREAASETLGALSVSGAPASAIIRNFYRG